MVRYYTTEAELLASAVNPGVGYRVNHWFSVGAGYSVLYAELVHRSLIHQGPGLRRHLALRSGGQYRFAEDWLLSMGAAYDTSPVDDAGKRMPDLPLDR